MYISKICIKTRKLIGLLYKCFHKYSSAVLCWNCSYASFIKPHLEYAAASWDPFLKKDIELIEDVQKFALRVCLKSWSATYEELLKHFNLPTLQTRRQHAKLSSFQRMKQLFSWSSHTSKTTLLPNFTPYTLVHWSRYQPTHRSSTTLISQVLLLHGTHYLLTQPLLCPCLHSSLLSGDAN